MEDIIKILNLYRRKLKAIDDSKIDKSIPIEQLRTAKFKLLSDIIDRLGGKKVQTSKKSGTRILIE